MVVAAAHACVILPVKAFAQGKTRLRTRLSDRARAGLAREMFLRALHASLRCTAVSVTYVITNGDDVAELVQLHDTDRRAVVLRDPRPTMTLAELMDWALAEATRRAAARALILMADLPELETRDVFALCAALDHSECVLVADQRGQSTNALGVHLPFLGQTAFGQPDSFARHSAHARALELRSQVLAYGRVAYDVDIPEDLGLTPDPSMSLDECHGDVAGKHQGW